MLGWVGEPVEALDYPGDYVAPVVDAPYYSDAWPPVLHVGDCEIGPVATYELRATADAISFSDPLEVPTILEPGGEKRWADCIGFFDNGVWTPPNPVLNFSDVQAAVKTYQVDPEAPHWSWVDMDAEIPNAVINFTDIQLIVKGFQGRDYPFSAPVDCP